MKLRPLVAVAMGALGLAGCQLSQNLQSDEADLARRVLEDSCVVGTVQSGSLGGLMQSGSLQMESIRMGKVSKLDQYFRFRSVVGMDASRIGIFSIQDLPDGWAVADAAYEGRRDNLYFNRQSGEFVCSTDEWRAVKASPKSPAFEKSPLIIAPAPNTVR